MKMKMEHADLDVITDDRKFQDVALLVDRKDFTYKLTELKKTGVPQDQLARLIGETNILSHDLLVMFRYPRSFVPALAKVIEGEKVTDEDVKDLYKPINVVYGEFIPKGDPIHILNVNIPWKWHQEKLIKELNQMAKTIWKNTRKHSILGLPPVPNIRRNRKWYWLHENGYSYRDIADSANKRRGHIISREGVIKAITRYEAYLNMDI